ncbi:MAG: PPE domain-containing protein [Mycobacterium sp.]|uniref:PPE family protein, SVP subgroup n=1 Tax=Mycobacterium sp. TaxID=1785 RepID=UPI003CC51A7B
MDFAVLSPEINSGRLYAGPGSQSMVAAAEAWDTLAAELYSAANSYKSVISSLTSGPWQGPSSASMAAAAASNVTWLTNTAAQAEEAASQARAAVNAYQEAYASVVPPTTIAANRSRLMALIPKNIFGQYTSAIATLEAQYAEMWATDAAVMYSYAGSSAAATNLSPFVPPQQATNESGQAAAVQQAAGAPAGNAQNIVSTAQQSMSAVPNALQSLATAAPAAAAPAQAADPLGTLSDLISIFLDAPSALSSLFVTTPLAPLAAVSLPLDVIGAGTGLSTDDIVSGWAGKESWPGSGDRPPTEFPAIITGPIVPATPAAAPPLSAGLGEANTVGNLSVPPTWSIATPAVRPVAYTLPALPPGAASPAAAAAETGSTLASSPTLSEMALAGMAGRAMAGTVGGVGKTGGKALHRASAPTDTGAKVNNVHGATEQGGETPQDKPRAVVTGVAAELREFAKLRDEGILTDEEYTEQKNRLLGR